MNVHIDIDLLKKIGQNILTIRAISKHGTQTTLFYFALSFKT